MKNNGEPSEIWFVEENNKDKPNRFPAGWKKNQLIYHDNSPISSNVMIDELLSNQIPNNWLICLDKIRNENIGKPLQLRHPSDSYSPPYAPRSSEYSGPDPNKPLYDPSHPLYEQYKPVYDPNSPTFCLNQSSLCPH